MSFARIRLRRDGEGQLRIARTYTFEFSDTGNNRRHGAIVMLGGELQDLQLEPYRDAMSAKFHAGRVIENRHWTDTLFSLRVEGPRLKFEAGQFVRIGIEPTLVRAFSFVNPPEDPVLEFYGVVVPQGRCRRGLRALRRAMCCMSHPIRPVFSYCRRCPMRKLSGSCPPEPVLRRFFPY